MAQNSRSHRSATLPARPPAAAAAFADGVLSALESLLSWEAGIALLDALVSVIQAVFAPIVAGLRLLADCAIFFWSKIAEGVGNLVGWLRTLADIATGIVMALVAPPISFITFFAGAVWLYASGHVAIPARPKGWTRGTRRGRRSRGDERRGHAWRDDHRRDRDRPVHLGAQARTACQRQAVLDRGRGARSAAKPS